LFGYVPRTKTVGGLSVVKAMKPSFALSIPETKPSSPRFRPLIASSPMRI